MKRILLRLWLLALLLCAVPSPVSLAMAQGIPTYGQQREERIGQQDDILRAFAEEPQPPIESIFMQSEPSQRVSSSRPSRILPFHGGKPGRNLGNHYHSSHYNQQVSLQLCYCHFTAVTVAASPRYYYVIALRRILC